LQIFFGNEGLTYFLGTKFSFNFETNRIIIQVLLKLIRTVLPVLQPYLDLPALACLVKSRYNRIKHGNYYEISQASLKANLQANQTRGLTVELVLVSLSIVPIRK